MPVTILTTQDILSYILAFIKAKNPQLDLQTGSDLYDIILHGNSQVAAKLFEELKNVENLQSIFTTTGVDLDLVARNYNSSRKKATYASGFVTFYTASTTSDIIIPDRTIVGVKGTVGLSGMAYTTIGSYAMLYSQRAANFNSLTGRYEILVPVTATLPGSMGNSDIGMVSIVQSTINQIHGCVNDDPISGGSDLESDSDLQQRCVLSWVVSSVGTKDGYRKLFLDHEVVKDAFAVGPFDMESTRQGVDVYVVTTSPLSSVSPQSFVYADDQYTILTNQPVTDIYSITVDDSWNLIENVSYTFNKQINTAYANSFVADYSNNRVDWKQPISNFVSVGASYDTFTFPSSGGAITVFYEDAYVNSTLIFTPTAAPNGGVIRSITASSYNTTNNSMTLTITPACTATIDAGNAFTLDPRPQIGSTVDINYLYNGDIQTLQDYINQSSLNVVGANILVKNGLRSKLFLTINIKLFSGYDFPTVKSKVASAIMQYINTLQVGAGVQLSDIIVVAQTGRGTDYTILEVDYVDIDTESDKSYIEHWGGLNSGFSAADIIELESREYVILSGAALTVNQI